ncbi:palmitoyltransferase pfa4 [Coccidioides immitis H538.4]|uniref:Palmitoyltransferase pfa4 n=1 Tax=Coccidioides immitis H538.4 TaxID=396776 RepID=A0A0J8RNP7_COCIT|nr:palmitoyltransferase pfa4 [Coccidioides immitis H538.4]
MPTSMGGFAASQLAVPAVCTLIAFLSYTSQYLFYEIDPGPLSKSESIKFNALVVCIWICYARACATDPGSVPLAGSRLSPMRHLETHLEGDPALMSRSRQRWCREMRGIQAAKGASLQIPVRSVFRRWTITVLGQTIGIHCMEQQKFTYHDSISDGNDSIKGYYSSDSGEEGWRNSDGDRLRDFGVDEEAEFYDEDDIPLTVLIQRKNQAKEKSLAVGG